MAIEDKEKDLDKIQFEVIGILRKYKLNTCVVDEVNAVFGKANPTMRISINRLEKPRRIADLIYYKANFPYSPFLEYLLIVGADGVDRGKGVWLVEIAHNLVNEVKLDIKRALKYGSVRELPTLLPNLMFYSYEDRKGARVDIDHVRKNHGIYFEYYGPEGTHLTNKRMVVSR